jgi:RNA polymerase sigma-70 factor (ECF subfamily)
MDNEEAALIEAAQKGCELAFEKLYLRYREAIAALIFRYTGNYQDTEELLQDIFVRSFFAIKRYKPQPDSSLFSWIYRIGINCAINFIKRKKRQTLQPESEIRETHIKSWRSSGPEEKYVNMEIRKAFYEAMGSLSPGQRMAFILKHSNQMSTAEVADLMRCSEGSVRKQLYRAVVKLRLAMALFKGGES